MLLSFAYLLLFLAVGLLLLAFWKVEKDLAARQKN